MERQCKAKTVLPAPKGEDAQRHHHDYSNDLPRPKLVGGGFHGEISACWRDHVPAKIGNTRAFFGQPDAREAVIPLISMKKNGPISPLTF